MTSAMNIIMNEIHFNIPRDILNLAYSQNTNYRNPITTVDDEISTEVIRKRVMVDLNLASQETLIIPLSKCQLMHYDDFKTAYFIPKDLTEGRSVISVHNMLTDSHLHGSGSITSSSVPGSSLVNSADDIMNSLDDVDIRQTARIDLIGENTILIDMGMMFNLALNITVVLENEENLNNINPRAFKTLSEGCIYAVKSHIYNTMVIQINKGMIYSGHELSVIKDIIDDYREAEEQYREWYNEKWKITAFTQNDKAMSNYITSMIGSNV